MALDTADKSKCFGWIQAQSRLYSNDSDEEVGRSDVLTRTRENRKMKVALTKFGVVVRCSALLYSRGARVSLRGLELRGGCRRFGCVLTAIGRRLAAAFILPAPTAARLLTDSPDIRLQSAPANSPEAFVSLKLLLTERSTAFHWHTEV